MRSFASRDPIHTSSTSCSPAAPASCRRSAWVVTGSTTAISAGAQLHLPFRCWPLDRFRRSGSQSFPGGFATTACSRSPSSATIPWGRRPAILVLVPRRCPASDNEKSLMERDSVRLHRSGRPGHWCQRRHRAVTARMFAPTVPTSPSPREPPPRSRSARRSSARESGRRCLPWPPTSTKPSRCGEMVESTLAEFGRIDILINNAGNSVHRRCATSPRSYWQWGRALNMDSAAYCTMEVGKHFIERERGVIVNISSVAGITGTMGEVPDRLERPDADVDRWPRRNGADYGFRVNCVSPALTMTEKLQVEGLMQASLRWTASPRASAAARRHVRGSRGTRSSSWPATTPRTSPDRPGG